MTIKQGELLSSRLLVSHWLGTVHVHILTNHINQ